MKIALFDLDGCISDDSRRRKYAPDWEKYHEDAINDPYINNHLVEAHRRDNHMLLFVTARPESQREVTKTWLERNLRWTMADKYDLLMRPDGDERSSPDLKVFLVEDSMYSWSEIVAAYDDRPDVLKAYEERGLLNTQLVCSTGPAAVLRAMADTYEKRNSVYGDNYKNVASVMRALFPYGVPSQLVLDERWHLFELLIVKLTRFANQSFGHQDSIHDAAIYAAMIESITEER